MRPRADIDRRPQHVHVHAYPCMLLLASLYMYTFMCTSMHMYMDTFMYT